MNELFTMLTPLSAAATGALISAIWQGTLLAALVLLAIRMFPGLSSAARSVIWLNVFLLLAVLHLMPLAIHSGGAAREPAFHADPLWSIAVAGVWLALSLGRAVLLMAGAVHVRGLALRATAVTAENVAEEVKELLRTPSGGVVELCVSDEVARPSVLGFFRPRILMPPGLLERLSPAELRQVVLHEVEHLRRHDDWTNLIQKLGLVLFPLNPALLWVERQLCAERELACDDRVMSSGGGRRAYALCLTHLAEHSMLRRGYALVLGAWERRPELVRRVHRILRQPARRMGRRPALAVTGGLMAGALGCALTLAHAPQLVTFAPAAEQARSLAPINPRELGLSGTAQFARADMPVHSGTRPVREVPVKATIVRRTVHPRVPASRLAELRTPPPAQYGTLLVMAEWTDEAPTRFVVTMEQTQRGRSAAVGSDARQMRPAMVVPAVYAVMTPNGWLILQI